MPGLSLFAASLGPPPKARDPPRLARGQSCESPGTAGYSFGRPFRLPPSLGDCSPKPRRGPNYVGEPLHKPGLRGIWRLQRRPWPIRRFVFEGLSEEGKTAGRIGRQHGRFHAGGGFRRVYPSQPVPKSLDELMQDPRPFQFSAYLERYRGYQQQRDLGVMMFMLSQVANLMLAGNHFGAMDRLALILVAIEQAAQDAGKWEVAYTCHFPRTHRIRCFRAGQLPTTRASVLGPLYARPLGQQPPLPTSKKQTRYLPGETRRMQGSHPQGRRRRQRASKAPRRPRFPKAPKQEK